MISSTLQAAAGDDLTGSGVRFDHVTKRFGDSVAVVQFFCHLQEFLPRQCNVVGAGGHDQFGNDGRRFHQYDQ